MEGPADPTSAGDAGTQPPDDDPDAALRAALSAAPAEGISVAELVAITRMSRRWVYYRLGELAADGHAEQTPRRLWRITHRDGRP
jgi:hypothetical protein